MLSNLKERNCCLSPEKLRTQSKAKRNFSFVFFKQKSLCFYTKSLTKKSFVCLFWSVKNFTISICGQSKNTRPENVFFQITTCTQLPTCNVWSGRRGCSHNLTRNTLLIKVALGLPGLGGRTFFSQFFIILSSHQITQLFWMGELKLGMESNIF